MGWICPRKEKKIETENHKRKAQKVKEKEKRERLLKFLKKVEGESNYMGHQNITAWDAKMSGAGPHEY